MAAVISLNASPAGVLRSLRGPIVAARPSYPDVLHVEIRDSQGDLWRLATQDAEWSPSDPSELLDHSVESADLDEESGELRLSLSGGSSLKVVPALQEADDDPPNWKLFTPDGLVMVFGPGGRWQFNRADEASALPLGREAVARSASASTEGDLMEVLAREEALSRQLLRELPLARNYQMRVMTFVAGISIASVVVAIVSLVLSLR